MSEKNEKSRADRAMKRYETKQRRLMLRALGGGLFFLAVLGASLIVGGIVYEQYFGSSDVAVAIMSPLQAVCSAFLAVTAALYVVFFKLFDLVRLWRDIWK